MDKVQMLVWNNDIHSTAVFAMMEKHLSQAVPDEAVQLDSFSVFRADRDFQAVEESRGGGLLFFVNKRWCLEVSVIHQHYSPSL